MKSRRRYRLAAKAASLTAAAALLANHVLAQSLDCGQPDTPTPPPARAIGSPSRGCLSGAEALPLDGPGWQVMRPSRLRYYGHPQLISFIERLAAVADRMGGGILIGDMALPRGGPMPSGHRSHQIGLDVDIWFLPAPPSPFAPADQEQVSATSMVSSDGQSVDPTNWTSWQATLLEQAALDPQVDRIFVNPAIKRVLCESATTDHAWLQKIRPWWGHDDHFHVRLFCPEGEEACVRTEAVPASGWLRCIAGLVVFCRGEGDVATEGERTAEDIDARRPAGRLPSHPRRCIRTGRMRFAKTAGAGSHYGCRGPFG